MESWWSASRMAPGATPSSFSFSGGSFGAQAGAQSTDLVLVFQSQKGLDRFIKGKGKLTLGVDAGIAAGPAGKRFEASTDAGLQAEILSYSEHPRHLRGRFRRRGNVANRLEIQHLLLQPARIPRGDPRDQQPPAVPASTISLQQLLAEKTAWPERIVKAGRARKEPVIVDSETTFFDDPDGIEIDGAIRRDTLPDAASPQPRAPVRREVRPQAEPAERRPRCHPPAHQPEQDTGSNQTQAPTPQ